MPPAINCNSKLPGSSSSISLNESPSPIEEINYDSDISEDDHAIAEGDDDEYDDEEEDDGDAEQEEEPDEDFAVEVNTLTGSTFQIMIHPSDTVEVLKTRIAFQEGISPADQNILLDTTTGCSDNATVQELNIDRNSKLTLVTNVASGVPFKTTTSSVPVPGGNGIVDLMGGGHEERNPSSFKLAPTIKRNYNNNNVSNNIHSTNNQQKNSSSSSSTSLRLPKILTDKSNISVGIGHNGNGINGNSNCGSGGAMHRNGESQQEELLQREREWMKSLFNKVVHQNEEDVQYKDDHDGAHRHRHRPDDDDEFCNDRTKIILDIDSTNNGGISPTTGALPYERNGPRISTRYVGTKETPDEDGSILVVQGDDGMILIIQKNTGQLLEESISDSNNNNRNGRYYKHKSNNPFDEEEKIDGWSSEKINNGRIGRLGRYTKNNSENYSVNSSISSSYKKSRYQQENKLVHDKIKENAVTLEKMRQVRSMMAQQKFDRSGRGEEDEVSEGVVQLEGMGSRVGQVKTLEFPPLLGGGMKNGSGAVGYKSGGMTMGALRKKSAGGEGGRILRSINSSKMSLNRLIAEIYLQTKRKDRHGFQPGQPPYTEQQLLRYVQLKMAILLDEQKKNKAEPCSKCQLDEDWSFNESAPYLIPTVVMNRFKRLANGRNSKSLDKAENDDYDFDIMKASSFRRKSMIPVISSRPSITNAQTNQRSSISNGRNNSGGSYIPRLILVNRGERENEADIGANRNNSVATTASSTISRRSSSSMTNKVNGAYQRVSCHSSGDNITYYGGKVDEDETVGGDDADEGICDTIIITSSRGSGRARPSFKIYPKMYSNSTSFYGKSSSSRPGSSKANTAKKCSVRCQTCKKKVGIACRYQCRCGLTFCSIHRYPEVHECTFDYKTEGRNKLRANNPVIVAPKIQEI